MYVLNVPGEDERWLRMLRVLEESFPPGALVHRFDTVSLEDDRIVEYPGDGKGEPQYEKVKKMDANCTQLLRREPTGAHILGAALL